MPIRGHPSGRGGSQALKTASLGRDGAGLEVPNSGIWELQKTSALVSLHLGRRRGTAAQGHGGKRQTWTQPRSLLFLTGEAASTQGKGNGCSSPTQINSFSNDSAHRQVGRPDRLPRVPRWDWRHPKEKVQGGFELRPQQRGDAGPTWGPWLRETLVSQPQQPESGLPGECHLLLLSNPCANS